MKAAASCMTLRLVRRMSLFQSCGFIGGKWKECNAKFPVYNPATGEEIGKVSDMGTKEADEAVTEAYKAFKVWKNSTANVRGMISSCTCHELLYKLIGLIDHFTVVAKLPGLRMEARLLF